MADTIDYNSKEMHKYNKVIDLLEGFLESFSASEWPKLDNMRLSDFTLSDIIGKPILYSLEFSYDFSMKYYYFCGYYLNEGNNHSAAVLKRPEDDGWDYIRVLKDIPRFFKATTLNIEKTASSTDKILELIEEIKEGSIVELTDDDGLKIMGFFRGVENGIIRISFGFDPDSRSFESFSNTSLYKNYYNDASIHGFIIPDFTVDTCKQFTLLKTSGGFSNIKSKCESAETRNAAIPEVCDGLLESAIENRVDALLVKSDRRRLFAYRKVHGIDTIIGLFSEDYGGGILSRFKIFAGLDLAEHIEHQSGEFTYKHKEVEYPMKIEIQYFENDEYQMEISFI